MASIAQRQRLSKAQRRQRRQQQTRKNRAIRRQLRQAYDQLPRPIHTLCYTLAHAFTKATALRFSLLLGAAILTIGRHTVANLLRTLGPLVPGDASSYRRLFSQRRWSSWRLAKLLAGWVLEHLLPDGPIVLAGDDTVDEHRGKNVYGKGRHRDPVRSTHSYTAFRWGHKWIVLAVLVELPFTRRRHQGPAGFIAYTCRWNYPSHAAATKRRPCRHFNIVHLRNGSGRGRPRPPLPLDMAETEPAPTPFPAGRPAVELQARHQPRPEPPERRRQPAGGHPSRGQPPALASPKGARRGSGTGLARRPAPARPSGPRRPGRSASHFSSGHWSWHTSLSGLTSQKGPRGDTPAGQAASECVNQTWAGV